MPVPVAPPRFFARRLRLAGSPRGVRPSILFLAVALAPVLGAVPAITFNEHIQSIIAENCFQCHGSDAHGRKAELRLDRFESATAPRKDGGPAIVPGAPDKSPLIQRIESTDPKQIMPPPESHKHLTPDQIALLRRWIKEGATYQEHWAYLAPRRPLVPVISRSVIRSQASGAASLATAPPITDYSSPIDAFVRARLVDEIIAPAPEADKRALIRRATFDLTGLPPTPDEIAGFLADVSPRAYERLVDRLLASPRYGEHRARYWLDAARFGDTHGLHRDNYRQSWPYRDYVIRAFNSNKRFDRFVVEQLAGDLLPADNFDQLVATGFVRAHLTTSESGEVTEMLQSHIVTDRVDTVATVFLGATASCASCHDHKFDPLSQKEFYQLGAFFNNTLDPPFDDEEAGWFPTLTLPPAGKEAEAAALLHQRAEVDRRLVARADGAAKAVQAWIAAGTPGLHAPVSPEKLLARFRFDEGRGTIAHNSAPGAAPGEFPFTGADPIWGEYIRHWPSLRFAANTKLELGPLGDFKATEAFSVTGWFQPRVGRSTKRGALVAKVLLDGKPRGWELAWDDATTKETPKFQRWPEGRLTVSLFGADPAKFITVRARPAVGRLEWSHLAFTYDGSGRAAGLALFVNGGRQEVEIVKDTLDGDSIQTVAPLQLGRRTVGEKTPDKTPMFETSYQDIRLYARRLADVEIRGTMRDDVVRETLALAPAQWSDDQRTLVANFYLEEIDAEVIALRAERARLDGQIVAATAGGPTTLVLQEKTTPPIAYVLDRGQFDRRKERVAPAVPSFLPPLPPGAPRNRLGFAQWLVAPEHPLTARVTVNRMWQEIFGTGLVATPRDFGIVGARPSHFALLDWLAVDFRESGWDVKRFYKQIVMSATYRQSARVTPALALRDLQNRLFARGPRFRLDAETLRDSALFAGGLLVEKTGGPSVNTYQPPGLWEAMSMDGSNTRVQKRDAGGDLYRRGVYTFWKRIAPPPVMTTFDAPQRDVCVVQRDRTNTPLQALIVLNSPDFLEAARHLAARAMRLPDAGEEQRIDFMADALLTARLSAIDRAALAESYAAFRGRFTDGTAREFLAVGDSPVDASLPPREFAAWTVVASQLMNTDRALNK